MELRGKGGVSSFHPSCGCAVPCHSNLRTSLDNCLDSLFSTKEEIGVENDPTVLEKDADGNASKTKVPQLSAL